MPELVLGKFLFSAHKPRFGMAATWAATWDLPLDIYLNYIQVNIGLSASCSNSEHNRGMNVAVM